MKNNFHSLESTPLTQGKDTKTTHDKQLFKILFTKPVSRRMAATALGYTDQTFMVTQTIMDWIKNGKAQVVGRIKCRRSRRIVEAVSTNPKFFKSVNDNNLKTFE